MSCLETGGGWLRNRLVLDVRRERLGGPESASAWIEADHQNGLTYAARIVGVGKYAVIAEAKVFPTQPDRVEARTDFLGRSHGERSRRGGEIVDADASPSPGGLTTGDVRKMPTDALLSMARARLLKIAEVPSPVLDCFPELSVPRREGERPHRRDDRAVANVAATYAELVESGHRKPLRRTAELHGYAIKGVEKVIAAARERDILTPTTQGKAGGELTNLGRQLAQSQ